MEQNYFQKISRAMAAADSLQFIDLSLDEVGRMCDVPASMLEAAMYSVNPGILTRREKLRAMLGGEVSADASVNRPDRGFEMKLKRGVRRPAFDKYSSAIAAFAVSDRPLVDVCREHGVSYAACRTFMMRNYPEAAGRHRSLAAGKASAGKPPGLPENIR